MGLRWRGVRHADRLHGLRVLGRRPGGVAGGVRDAGGAAQCACPVRAPAGGLADQRGRVRHRRGLRGRAVRRRPADDRRRRVESHRGAPGSATSAVRAPGDGALHRPAGGEVRAAGRGVAGASPRGRMIHELRIRALGVIDEAVIPFAAGLTVLTGETGAGKTMVLTGLGLIRGGKADAGLVRTGADHADVDAEWRLPADASEGWVRGVLDRLEEAGGACESDGDELVLLLGRSVAAGGRSRAFAGGRSVPASVLAELGESLMAVHGQADQLLIRDPRRQRDLLDLFAGRDVLALRAAYAADFTAWRAATRELRDLVEHRQEREREAALLRHGIDEIAAVEPVPGEDEALKMQASVLAHATDLLADVGSAHAAADGQRRRVGGERHRPPHARTAIARPCPGPRRVPGTGGRAARSPRRVGGRGSRGARRVRPRGRCRSGPAGGGRGAPAGDQCPEAPVRPGARRRPRLVVGRAGVRVRGRRCRRPCRRSWRRRCRSSRDASSQQRPSSPPSGALRASGSGTRSRPSCTTWRCPTPPSLSRSAAPASPRRSLPTEPTR